MLGVAALRTVTSLPLHSVCAAFTALNIVKDKLIDRPVRAFVYVVEHVTVNAGHPDYRSSDLEWHAL